MRSRLQSHPRKNVDVALVCKHEKVTGGGFVNSANGNLGEHQEGKYDEIGEFGQMVF